MRGQSSSRTVSSLAPDPFPPHEWWKTHFDRLSLSGYGLPKKTEMESRCAARMLGLKKPADVLDLACGAGRHSLGLAALGHRVVGLDWSKDLLESAGQAAQAAGVRARFVHGDMRRLRYRARFDAAVNLFTSFGYFETEAEDVAVLRGVRRALRPQGRFLIDLLNKDWLLRHFTPAFWQKEPDGAVIKAFNRLSFDASSSRLSNHRTVYTRGGRRLKTFLRFKVYALEDMERLFSAAGLRVRGVWGGFDGRPCGKDAFRLIVLGQNVKRLPSGTAVSEHMQDVISSQFFSAEAIIDSVGSFSDCFDTSRVGFLSDSLCGPQPAVAQNAMKAAA